APQNVVAQDKTTGTEGADARYSRPGRLSAYLYRLTGNAAYAQKAWAGVTGGPNRPRGGRYATSALKGPDVVSPIEEVTGISTNSVAQNCLELIEELEICGDRLPVA